MLKQIHRGLWMAASLFFFLLGVIGLFIPVVPQLSFFLAAILCLMRGSNRFAAWMETKPWFIRLRKRFHRRQRGPKI